MAAHLAQGNPGHLARFGIELRSGTLIMSWSSSMYELRVICFVAFAYCTSDAVAQDSPAPRKAISLKSPTELIAVAFSVDGDRVATSSRTDVRVWNSAT